MYCTKCGAKLPRDARFCMNCGKPVAAIAPVSATTRLLGVTSAVAPAKVTAPIAEPAAVSAEAAAPAASSAKAAESTASSRRPLRPLPYLRRASSQWVRRRKLSRPQLRPGTLRPQSRLRRPLWLRVQQKQWFATSFDSLQSRFTHSSDPSSRKRRFCG